MLTAPAIFLFTKSLLIDLGEPNRERPNHDRDW